MLELEEFEKRYIPSASKPILNDAIVSVQQATAIYVSTRGSNSNDGLSANTPLKTISYAMGMLKPGMTLYLQGGTYYEQMVTKVAGTFQQPININSYNGLATLDGSTQKWTNGSNQNQGMIEVRHDNYNITGIKVVNSKNTGIVLAANYILISNCDISYSQRHAISTDTKYQANQYAGYMIKNIILANNTIYQNVLKGLGYGQAISLIADGFTVVSNQVYNNVTEGIDIWLGATHGQVSGNNVYNNKRCGIFVDGASYVSISNNICYNNLRDGIGISSEDIHYSCHDIWVYNNIVNANKACGIFVWDDTSNAGFQGCQNILIANNTLINNLTNIYIHGNFNSVELMNNLGYSKGTNYYSDAKNSTINIHNNLWLKDLSGFVSPSTNDFRLKSTSPAIDKGSKLPVLVDNIGNTFFLLAEKAGLVQVGKLPWANHPAVRMWRGFESFLVCYYNVFWSYCVEVHKIKVSKLQKKENLFGATPNPEWFGDERLHASHRSNLLRKNKEFYSKYNWLEDDSLPYFWPK